MLKMYFFTFYWIFAKLRVCLHRAEAKVNFSFITDRKGKVMFSQVSHGYSFTACPSYCAVGMHPTECILVFLIFFFDFFPLSLGVNGLLRSRTLLLCSVRKLLGKKNNLD